MTPRFAAVGLLVGIASASSALAGGTPVNTGTPDITGTPKVGTTLTCLKGTWAGADSFTFAWLRDGARIAGATLPLYTVKTADRRHALVCQVLAQNAGGGTVAQSRPVAIDPRMGVKSLRSGGRRATLTLTCPRGTEGCQPTRITIRQKNRIAFRGPVQAVNEGTSSVSIGLVFTVRRRSTVSVAITWSRDDGGPSVAQPAADVQVR